MTILAIKLIEENDYERAEPTHFLSDGQVCPLVITLIRIRCRLDQGDDQNSKGAQQ